MSAPVRQPTTITVRLPMTFNVRSARKSVVSPSTPIYNKRTDNALLVALARAHRWRQQIESGEFASITELAKAKSVNESYACRLLRLTLLAPAIVTKIMNDQNSSLRLKDVLKPFPERWDEQPL